MAVDYDEVHRTVIRPRWHAVPDQDKHGARFPNRRGQLQPDAPEAHALYDTFTYQPGHVDVFRGAYEASPHSPPTRGDRLMIVDVGAGAGTVAAAVGEALGRSKRSRIGYRAVEPNRTMRKLGTRVLRHLDAGFNSAKYARSLDNIDFEDEQRLLFTFSYVSHQHAVDSADVDQWTIAIERAMSDANGNVEVLYTTAELSREGYLPLLHERLSEKGILVRRAPVPVEVPRRYPLLGSTARDARWDNQDILWDVEAEHWTLTL